MKLEREIERHKKILEQIENARCIGDLPNVSISNVLSFLSTNVSFEEKRFDRNDFKGVLDTILSYGSVATLEVKDAFFDVVHNKYPEIPNEEIMKKYKEIFSNPRIEYIIYEVGLKNIKTKEITKEINKENHEEIMKEIRNCYDIKSLPSVGLSELNKRILRNVNNNSLKKRFKVSDLTEFTNLYLNNTGVGIADTIIKFCESLDLTEEEKRYLFEELVHNFANDETVLYAAEEIKAKEKRKLEIYKLDHEETMENIKSATRISQLPPNLSKSSLTSYLLGNSTIYTNDNRFKSENLYNLTDLLLVGKNFDDEEVKEEIKKLVKELYSEKSDAYELLVNKYKNLPKTYYLAEEVKYDLEREKEFIINNNSNVNVYFIPNYKNQTDGGKFLNVYINRVNNLDLDKILPLNLDEIVPPRLDIDSIEWWVQEKVDPTFKLVGGIILKKDETIGNVNIFRPNDGKIGVSKEEKEKMNKIDNLDNEILEKEEKLKKLNEEISEKEELSNNIDLEMNKIISINKKKALELYKHMLEEISTLESNVTSKKLTYKKED